MIEAKNAATAATAATATTDFDTEKRRETGSSTDLDAHGARKPGSSTGDDEIGKIRQQIIGFKRIRDDDLITEDGLRRPQRLISTWSEGWLVWGRGDLGDFE